ncbi:MAG: putative peptidoglycan glycosyltransferase FtsW [Candidatus Peregrinibacteria bacterium]
MLRRMDFLLLGITVVLTLFGLAMISSVSVFKSFQITSQLVERGLMDAPSNSFYLWRSFLQVILGFCVMGFTMIVPYRMWERLALPVFAISLLLLLSVFLPGIRADFGTARSWIRLGFFSMQPSEFFKPALVFYLALWLQKREQLIGTWKEGFIPFAMLIVVSTIMVALQPDLGSFLVLFAIAVVMFFVAGGNIFHVILGGAMASVLGLPIILQKEYIRDRFHAFFNPADPTIAETIGFQIRQALIAIGSGGVFGVGYGKSIQKFGYLPEVQADTIFAAMAEELGFLRLLIILGMFAIFIVRGYKIAQEAPDRFGFLVAMGITTWIAVQTILNIAVNLAIFPLTGITLPFISAGGSSLISLLASVGILLNISMHSTEAAVTARRTPRRLLSFMGR